MPGKEKHIYFEIMLESLEKLTQYVGTMSFDEFDHDSKGYPSLKAWGLPVLVYSKYLFSF